MKTKYLSHKLTEKIEVNREQAAEILSDLKRYTAAFPNLHQDDTLSSLKEKSIFLYNHVFMAEDFKMALETEETFNFFTKNSKKIGNSFDKKKFSRNLAGNGGNFISWKTKK